jgi:hypothetical protein
MSPGSSHQTIRDDKDSLSLPDGHFEPEPGPQPTTRRASLGGLCESADRCSGEGRQLKHVGHAPAGPTHPRALTIYRQSPEKFHAVATAYLQRLYMPQRAMETKLLWAHFVLINTHVHGGSPQIQQIEPGIHCQQP